MSLLRTMIFACASLLLVVAAFAQDPNIKHFDKDGLSFDYPANCTLADQSTQQMQYLEITQGDTVIRVRAPREWLKTPEKETHARKLFQDKYVEDFALSVQQMSMTPKRSPATTQIAGVDAEGASVRAVMDRQPGGMDSYSRVISDRLVNLSRIGSEQDFVKSAAAWDTVRNSLKVAPPPQPTPKPSPTKVKP
jgi:hypothetical protein